MKKLFAAFLSALMLVSAATVFFVPASAVDGEWTVYGPASQYAAGFDGDPKSVAGYEYTNDGFHLIPGDWKGTTPWAHIQTKNKIDLKQGVYMQFRVDDFSLEATDKWLNVNFWDSAMIEPPVEGYGEGVQTLIRIKKYDGTNHDIKPIEWYTKNFTGMGTTNIPADKNLKTSDGKILVDVTVTWNGTTYAVEINGASAPQSVIDYMNERWGGDDSEAHVGVCAQNNVTGGTVELTVTKFGTTKDKATIPKGDDSRRPENHTFEKAPIASPDKIPANTPAVFMNGNKIDSDLKAMPKPIVNSTLSINEDYTLHVTANQGNVDSGVWFVKNEVSYDIKDFPIGVVLTRNFCTCKEDDGTCYAIENASVYMLTGESNAIGGNYVRDINLCMDPYMIGNDSYLYFYVDMMNDATFEASGRINGACFDFSNIDYDTPGANSFDIVFMAWFRTTEEAEAYVEAYLAGLGWVAPDDGDGSEDGETDEITDVDTEEQTPDTGNGDVVEPDESDKETNNANPEDKAEEKPEDEKKSGGCGSTVGFGATLIVALFAAVGAIAFKKKEE